MSQPKPMPLWLSFTLFIIPSVLLLFATQVVMPWLEQITGMLNVLTWFLAGGIFVFIPVFISTIIGFKLEKGLQTFDTFCQRMRMHPMNREDWKWVGMGLAGAFLGSGLLAGLFLLLSKWISDIQPLASSPPFLQFNGFPNGKEWMLIYWIPFFFFNIFGEELWWRGYILPRQELQHGKHAWLVNGLLWVVFHAAFGLDLMLIMLPLLLLQPWIVQKRKNTWIGIWIHALYNGPIFIAISLNLF